MYNKRRQDKTESENEENCKIINKKHKLFLSKAAEIALKSNMLHKHGAVIVYRNEIIASGFNELCDYMNSNYSIHAEVSAISKLFHNKKILELCDIYIVRVASSRFDNCLKNSKPCKNCTNFINKYNLRNIYYSTSFEYEKIKNDYFY